MTKYDHKEIEKKWQERWEKDRQYVVDVRKAKNPFYNLWMFPYPSGEGLHAGHAYASTGSDIYGRFMRMQGKDVFQPIGYDSFGIHSENFALKIGEHPKKMLDRTTKNYERQMRSLGHGYEWTKTVTTSDIDYYKWTQWIFVKLFKMGLAYRKKAEVNWCPGCKTVLADEQIMTPAQAGKTPPGYDRIESVPEGIKVCERCGNIPERKELEQWFFRITKYADRLLQGLEKIDWPEKIKVAQANWIDRSLGMKIRFGDIEVFTTRPDTLAGATFVVVAGEDKFTGKYVINPLTGKSIPVWEASYVNKDYGTGAVMGVPAHDERDREFAKKYGLKIMEMEPDESLWEKIEQQGWGERTTTYHLRDWLISRQRYWGPPIPMIYCKKCDWQPVPEEQLPVELPFLEDYKPGGKGRGPLADHPEFYKVKCPKCRGEAERETDVSDTFLDSAWYFLRYPSVGVGDKPWDEAITKKWLPVSLYFGGAEHAVLHLMYARFIAMALCDARLIDFEEPFPKFFAHGLMIKDGAKMSKSRGNVVNPDAYVDKFGADALRLYLMFIGPMDGSPDFRDTGMEGMCRWVERIWRIIDKNQEGESREITVALQRLVRKMTQDIGNYKYNTAIAGMMEFINLVSGEKSVMIRQQKEIFLRLLAPFAPHVAEELWERLGNTKSVHKQAWPEYDEGLVEEERVVMVVQVEGRMRDRLELGPTTLKLRGAQERIEQLARESAKVAKYLEGAKYRTIFVPGKVINFVRSDA